MGAVALYEVQRLTQAGLQQGCLNQARMAMMLTAIGLMSGTSLDGVDVALIETDGERVESFGPSGYRAYTRRTSAACCARRWPRPRR